MSSTTIEDYVHLIECINKNDHFVWKLQLSGSDNCHAVTTYVVYLKDGTTKIFETHYPCQFGDMAAIKKAAALTKRKIVDFLRTKDRFRQMYRGDWIRYIKQDSVTSFATRKNVIYESHSHSVTKLQDDCAFKASYTIVAKMKNEHEYYILHSNGQAFAASKGAAIREARRMAELEMTKYNLGPIEYR